MRFYLILCLIYCNIITSHSQTKDIFDGFSVLKIPTLKYKDGTVDKYGVNSKLMEIFRKHGISVCNEKSFSNYEKLVAENPCTLLNTSINIQWKPAGGGTRCYLTINFLDCNNSSVFSKTVDGMGMDLYSDVRKCIRKIKNTFYDLNYSFDSDKSIRFTGSVIAEKTNETEESIVDYLDNNRTDNIEGIYKHIKSETADPYYKIGIKKFSYKYKGIILETSSTFWKVGEVKFILEPSAVESMFSCKYYMGNKVEIETFASMPNLAMLEVDIPGQKSKSSFLKLYPSNIISSNVNQTPNNSSRNLEWKGNGSGIIISNDGYIVTNHHVVDKSNDIEVEFKHNQEIKSYSAKVVKTDQTNDLAIIKIEDPSYQNLKSIPYNFYSRSADIGTEVFALGYPMALSVMGKDIKFTDGRISSKTGYQGNITTYQTTTPIQPGNSGGPLFDHKANLLGINSSGLRKDIADNVSYTIKTNYLINLIDVLPKSIEIPSSTWIASKPLTEQIKILSNYVVLVKVR